MLFTHLEYERRITKRVFGFACVATLVLLYSVILRPDDVVSRLTYSRVVYDREGGILRITLSGDEKYRIRTKIDDLSPYLVDLVLFKEDRWFYFHPGANPVSVIKAAWHSLVAKDSSQGASTITMQLARMLYGTNTKTIPGKIEQIFRALQLELYYSKKRILETYLNLVPCGRNVEGYAAASLVYLGKRASELSLGEAMLLCVIPQSPYARTPDEAGANAELVEARDRLAKAWIDERGDDGLLASEIGLPIRVSNELPFRAPHFTNAVLAKYAEPEIRTTLDPRLQEILESRGRSYVERKREIGITNACMLLVDYRKMETRAYVGSVDFFDRGIEGQVNGVTAKRSPGSTIKPFIYALAFDEGIIHQMTMLKDSAMSFGSYNPDNFDGEFEGPVRALDALVKSRNVPAVYLASKLAKPDLYEFLVSCGVSGLKPREHYGLSLVLGGAEVSMEELIRMYALLANRGFLYTAADRVGQPARRNARDTRLLSDEACFMTLDALRRNPRPDALGINEWATDTAEVYWKTGTSMSFKDAWTVGVFDNFVLAVWIGNFNGAGNPAFVSLKAAAPLFFEITDAIRRNRLSEARPYAGYLEVPSGARKIEVCAVSGKIPNDFCRSEVLSWFIPGKSPISVCDIHREVYINTMTGYRTTMFDRGTTKREVYEFWPSDLLELFEQAGIPRKVPPQFDPLESYGLRDKAGRRPEITSPRLKTDYVIRAGDPEGGKVPLRAVADADSARVFWFVNDAFAGESKASETFFWQAVPGRFTIRAVDEYGRADECSLEVLSSD